MTEERKRASALDVSGFAARQIDKPDDELVAQVVEESPFRSRLVDAPVTGAAPRGRPHRGQKNTVFARVPERYFQQLQRIREEKGWSLVTALERAIDALAAREGVK